MKSKDRVLIIFLIVVSVLGWVVFGYQYYSKNKITKALLSQKESLTVELTNLSNDYQNIKTSNVGLQDSIAVQQDKIIETLHEVKRLKSENASLIFKYQNELATMRNIMKSYIRQIDELNQKNIKLLAENKKVKNRNNRLNKQFRQEKKKNSNLDKKLKEASMLSLLNARAYGVKKRNKITEKAADTKAIMVDFTLPANSVAKKGERTLYIRITMPDKMILAQSDKDLFKFNGEEISYSGKKVIDYDGKVNKVRMFWTNPTKIELTPGEYLVDIFTDDYELGSTSFVLKKSFNLFDW